MFLCSSFEVALHNLSSNQHFIILYWRLYFFLVMSSPFTYTTTFCICSYNTWIHECNENETDSKVIHVRYRSLTTMKDKEHCGEIVKRQRERERERERERQIHVRICYDLWVFATVANTHFSFYGYLLP